MLSKQNAKTLIKDNFKKHVFGRFPNDSELKSSHCGKLGHWLESNLGGKIDSDGNADLNGYECKVESKKTSWGDWGAPYKIFCDGSYKKLFYEEHIYENMWILCKTLGVKRVHDKHGVYFSMSGTHIPTYINDVSYIGLSLVEKNSDILITYSFSKDQRLNKVEVIPSEFKKDNILIYKWHGTDISFNKFKNDVVVEKLPIDVKLEGPKATVSLEERIRRKFGIHGMVVGMHDKNRKFYGLKFLKSITYQEWISFFKEKNVKYDTALTTRNKRPYNQWRSDKKFMETLVEEIYIP